MPSSKELLQSLAQANLSSLRPGDYNQAVMDLGATICTPRKPQCIKCPINLSCKANEIGDPEALPKKLQKKAKPLKFGSVFIGFNEKSGYLLERREGKGLLGGMLSWPSTDWSGCLNIKPPISADWIPVLGSVKHTFTHFNLDLSVFKAIGAAVLLGLCEPQSTGIGGDCFVLVKSPGEKDIIALNGSGRSPRKLRQTLNTI